MASRSAFPGRRSWLILAGLLISAAPAIAQQADSQPDVSPDARQEYVQMQQQMMQLFKDKDFTKAAALCDDILKKFPNDPVTYYNLACAQARLKNAGDALADLAKAVKHGWNDADQMKTDDDLASIRSDKQFSELLKQTQANELAGVKYEKGADIPGVKTVEGFPEGGLRYRIRLPQDATAEKPAKLIIWLHPSGGSMDSAVEKLAPQLAARGFALMVFTQKQTNGWKPQEVDELLNQTLPAVRKAYKEIDASRPILLGFSAGGQVALGLWSTNPGAWGGLIVDAAYPVTVKDQHYVPMELPAGDADKKTPMLALVGDKDRGVTVWDKVQNPWLEAKVPLTVKRIAGKGHSWLLTGDALKDALNWLDAVKAGNLPADAVNQKGLDM